MLRISFFAILAAIVLLSEGKSFAVGLAEAQNLLLKHDYIAVSKAFDAHQDSYDAGSIDQDAYLAAYRAFETSHPDALATIDAWHRAEPENLHATAARGISLTHKTNLLRGPYLPGTLPARAWDQLKVLANAAEDNLTTTLQNRRDHLPAALALDFIGAVSQQKEWRERALSSMSAHDDPLLVLLAELRFADFSDLPGGFSGFCGKRAPNVDGISFGQCVTLAQPKRVKTDTRLSHRRVGILPDPKEILEAIDFPTLAARDPAAAYKVATRSRAVLPEQALNLAYRVGPDKILEGIVLPRLAYDPLHPEWLTVLGTIQFQKGRPSHAWQSIGDALELGWHHPKVRLARAKAMSANQEMLWQTASELLDAFAATDGSVEIVARYQNRMVSPPETLSHNQDGTPNDVFQCLQLLFLERFAAWCTAGTSASGRPPSHKCTGAAAEKTGSLINDAKDSGNCGPAENWRDRVEWLIAN